MGGVTDIIGKITDPGDFFGAQAGKDAAATSSDLGYQTLAMQQEWMQYMKDQFEPYSQAGQSALSQQMSMLEGLSGGPDYAGAATSPMFLAQQAQIDQMGTDAQNAMMAQSAATGGLRGGNYQAGTSDIAVQQNLAEQQALNSAANQNYANDMGFFNTLGAISGKGLQGSQSLGSFGGNTMSGMSGTMSGIGTSGLNSAAMQQQQGSNLLSAGIGIASLFSDPRLKTNIKDTGRKSKKGFTIYTWDWNEKAKEIGLTGSDEGVLSSEVKAKIPSAITVDKSGYEKVNYARV